jgi:hypothetical protein
MGKRRARRGDRRRLGRRNRIPSRPAGQRPATARAGRRRPGSRAGARRGSPRGALAQGADHVVTTGEKATPEAPSRQTSPCAPPPTPLDQSEPPPPRSATASGPSEHPTAAPTDPCPRADPHAPAVARRVPYRALANLGRRALGADVGELFVDPIAGVALHDDLLEALRAQRPLLRLHGQGAVDLVRLLLDVERVH